MILKIGLVQFDRSALATRENHRKMITLLQENTTPPDLWVLPEGWLGPEVIDHHTHRAILQELQGCLGTPTDLLVSGGQYVRQDDGGVVATGALVTPGDIVCYDKLFPSGAIGEREFIQPGHRSPVVPYRGLKVGAVLCVDLFYPEITRHLARQGAELVFNPANIPAGRMDLWQQIGITRAAENTIFLVMVNNTKTKYPDHRRVLGRSFVAGPDGNFFQDFGTKPGLYFSNLDLDLTAKARQRWKYLEDIQNRQLC